MSNENEIELNIKIIVETKKDDPTNGAIMIKDLNDKDVWIPKSQIDISDSKDSMLISEWLAIDKELV